MFVLTFAIYKILWPYDRHRWTLNSKNELINSKQINSQIECSGKASGGATVGRQNFDSNIFWGRNVKDKANLAMCVCVFRLRKT